MPVTPTSPSFVGDPFAVNVAEVEDKENILPPSMQMHMMQQHHEPAVKHVSDDAAGVAANMFPVAPGTATFGRPKLSEINRIRHARVVLPSPRTGAAVHP